MVMQSSRLQSAKLANGEQVVANDHVYVSPPWSNRDGTPYWVARIIEFVPPSSATPKKGSRQTSNELQVRVSLYYRPSDISGRNVSDFRLLMAAIHTDIQPLSNVRGKCYVRHKDRIEDLLAWKRRPDHFYFVKFFDPYIKREFEVLRTENVHNIPVKVKEVLMTRYEYLITEREMVADLTDNYRTCCVCDEWAASQESVRCEACKKNYHMKCLNPPLANKPAKGYSWVCITCSLQRHKDVEDQKFHYGAAASGSGNGASKPAKAANAKGKEVAKGSMNRPDVCYRGWPWRYFGLYTKAEDTLDPDDQIFPRAATRVGTKYQANVPTWEEQQAIEASHRAHSGFLDNEAGPSRHIAVERGHDIGERKHEQTYDVMCTPSAELHYLMEDVAELDLPVPPYNVERLNRAATTFASLGSREAALEAMRRSKLSDFKPITFTDKENAIFEEQLERHGGLEVHETGKLLNRTDAEVLRYSYIWKNRKLKLENEALRAHVKVSTAHARQNKTLGAPSLGRIRGKGDSDASDDEVSLYNANFTSANKMQCAACSTRISTVWWRCPRSLPGNAMCETCGANYRKYGVISFVKSEDAKKPEKKEGGMGGKKGKGPAGADGSNSGASTPAPTTQAPKLPPCACCRRMEPKSMMARCKTCTFAVHSGCYGIASEQMGPQWECDLCANVRLEENSLEPRCVLCPRDNSALVKAVRKKPPVSDFDMLSAMKPTEGCQWAHVLCSAWIPEVVYTKPATLKAAEGISTILHDRWQEVCTLCSQSDGAVIYCSDCLTPFHASCAWQSGHKFGFEFSLAKPGKREVINITKFKEDAGVMNAGVWCKSHDLEGRVIYEMHDMDPELNETALQVYTAGYKGLPPHDETFALLRKARRLDTLLPVRPAADISVKQESESTRECANCHIDVSPRWHDDTTIGQKRKHDSCLCHLCWTAKREERMDIS